MSTATGLGRLLAGRTRGMRASTIREILKVVTDRDMVSLAGGIPAPESFPRELIRDLAAAVLDKYSSQALQYDRTEGFTPLREALAAYLPAKGIRATADDFLITSGSQGVLDLVGKILIDKGDVIAVEAPTYLGALQAFAPYEPGYVRMDTDDEGLVPESLERVLSTGRVKLVYLVPTFQNPTGRTIPLARREAIAAILREHDALLVEDDPYSALRYAGEPVPPIHSLAPEHVIYTGTFSKVLAPGLRLGYCVAPEPILKWLVVAKQGTDLHTSTFSQAIAAEYLAGGHLAAHLPRILAIYGPRLRAMLDALDRHFPAGFRWSRPQGGMFVWAEGPAGFDSERAHERALERGVAYVPGRVFFTEDGEGAGTMRLNFTKSDPETLDRAIETLAAVFAEAV